MNLVIVTNSLYPEGSAGAIRTHTFARLFRELGHRVTVLSNAKTGYLQNQVYDTISYRSLKVDGTDVVRRYLGYRFYARRMLKELKRIHRQTPVDAVLGTELKNNAIVKLKKFCRENGIRLILDATEWYTSEQFADGEKAKGYRENDYQNRVLLDATVNVIAISRYLEEHFREKGVHVVRIPMMYTERKTIVEGSGDTIRIGYAGSFERAKDHIVEIVDLLLKYPDEFKNMRFDFIGFGIDALVDYTEEQKKQLLNRCNFHGRKSHEDTLRILQECDFTIFFRNKEARNCKAGFPSKATESLSMGLPLITNLTSDLGEYLKEGENALLAEDHSEKAIASVMRRVQNLSREQIERMKKAALKTAEEKLYYTYFMKTMEMFLEELI